MTLPRVLVFLSFTASMAGGQTVSRNLSDGLTPPAIAPGAPPGVQAISSLERINLYNGQLSMAVPLLQVGGRGEAGYEMVARMGSAPWTLSLNTAPYCPDPQTGCIGFVHTASASNKELFPYESPYSPGLVFGKRSGLSPQFCPNAGETRYGIAFTHIVFEQPDGTQAKLWDGTGGAAAGCSASGATRGTRFVSLGEANLVFISDASIQDVNPTSTVDKFAVSGALLFPNGTEYRIDASVVTKITDRNGNFVTIRYVSSTTNPDLITDSLGRTVTIDHDVNDTTCGWVDRITYKGTGGGSRVICVERVRTGGLPIRAGLPTSGGFGNAGISYSNFDRLLKKITLPDGRNYQFQYTAYGELARLALPTGGAIEYDHGAGLANAGAVQGAYSDGAVLDEPGTIANTTDSDAGWRPTIYRRLVTRRTYPGGGSGAGAESTTAYSLRESASIPVIGNNKVTSLTISVLPYLEESTTGTGISTSIITRHSFFETADAPAPSWAGWPSASPLNAMLLHIGAVRMPNDDNAMEGTEYKTSMPGLHTTEKGYAVASDTSRAARICQETVLAGDSSSKRAETLLFYDARGNLTDTYAYGFGEGPELTRGNNSVPQSCGSPPAGNTYRKRTVISYLGTPAYLADNRHLSRLPLAEETFGPGATQVSKSIYEYDGRALLTAELSPVAGYDSVSYSATRTERGNVTGILRYKSSSSALTTAYQYDVLGNARYALTPNLVQAWTGYASTSGLDAAAANAGKWTYADACSTAIGSNKLLAFATGEQLPALTIGGTGFSTTATYDCWLGQATGFTDINSVSTAFGFGTAADANQDKLTLLTRAAGSGVEAQTSYSYGLTSPNVYVATGSALRTKNDGLLQTKSLFDGIGRETESREWNGTAWVVSKREYDGAHRVTKAWNPTTGTPSLYTNTTYDGLGRPTLVVAPGGATTTYAYLENAVTVTDPGKAARKTVMDALGRLESVTEDPLLTAAVTRYFYSATGNLLTVCPPGGTLSTSGACTGTAQARMFAYDWLGRLSTVTNPESSTISYGYDDTSSTNGMGNLTTKTQMRGVGTAVNVTTRFHYDNLGRMTSKVFTGSPDGIGTPTVTYFYDAHNPVISGVTSYSKGRRTRTAVAGGAATAVDSFDELGRPTRSRQETGASGPYRFGSDTVAGYEYLRNGALSVMRLPAGRTLTYSYDDAGRPVGVGDGATPYVSSVGYAEHGAVASMRMNGWRIREGRSYDPSRLQLTGITMDHCTDNTAACATPTALRSFGYSYQTSGTAGNGSGPDNNGSVRWQDITDPGITPAQRQVYGYDGLDRLKTFTEGPTGGTTVLSEIYCYDEHGNRAVLQRVGLSPLIPQVVSCTGSAVSGLFPGNRMAMTAYDAAGGMGNDGRSYLRYNGEDQLVKTWPVTGTVVETVYEYDGDGKRVSMKVGTAASTVFVYDAFGKLAAEYGASAVSSREFVGVDHLGSTRLVTGAAGEVVRRMDYWPFGMEINSVDTPVRTGALGFISDGKIRMKFTGKERDAETGLDYFGARYFSGAQGRFTSPDPHNILTEASSEEEFASFVSNPQNWNRYAYVTNNPLTITDPDGRCPWCPLFQQLGQRVSPYADKAAMAAQRFGQAGYLWATSFFNSPAGQQTMQAATELATGTVMPGSPVAGVNAQTGARIMTALGSSDGAKQMEGKVAQSLANSGLLKGFDVMIAGRQVDAIAGKAGQFIVEVTTGGGRGKIGQALAQMKDTGKQVVIYGEGLSKGFVKEAQKQGIRAAQNLEELKRLMGGE